MTLQSSILSPRRAAIPTFASYVGRPRRATMIANRARPRRPTRETARSLGTKLFGRVSGPARWGQANPRLPRYIQLRAKFEPNVIRLHPGEDVRRKGGRSVLLEERRRGEAMPGSGTGASATDLRVCS